MWPKSAVDLEQNTIKVSPGKTQNYGKPVLREVAADIAVQAGRGGQVEHPGASGDTVIEQAQQVVPGAVGLGTVDAGKIDLADETTTNKQKRAHLVYVRYGYSSCGRVRGLLTACCICWRGEVRIRLSRRSLAGDLLEDLCSKPSVMCDGRRQLSKAATA